MWNKGMASFSSVFVPSFLLSHNWISLTFACFTCRPAPPSCKWQKRWSKVLCSSLNNGFFLSRNRVEWQCMALQTTQQTVYCSWWIIKFLFTSCLHRVARKPLVKEAGVSWWQRVPGGFPLCHLHHVVIDCPFVCLLDVYLAFNHLTVSRLLCWLRLTRSDFSCPLW